jgi:hypothetical protein
LCLPWPGTRVRQVPAAPRGLLVGCRAVDEVILRLSELAAEWGVATSPAGRTVWARFNWPSP